MQKNDEYYETSEKKSQDKVNLYNYLISIWGKFKQKISNFKNYMKYNLMTFDTSLSDFNKFSRVRIFDHDFLVKSEQDKLNSELSYIIYFSYRSDFFPIDMNNQYWTTDCGWGCMIRASQMILSKAIFNLKLAELHENEEVKEEYYYEKSKKMNACFNTLVLFIETLEKIAVNNTTQIPNFSIYNICKHGVSFGKEPGQWFSDVNMVNIFCKINQESNILANTEIMTFNNNLIEEDEILNKCFKQAICECKMKKIRCECLKIKDKNYVLNKNGIIFVSCRVGLEYIYPEYFVPITRLFSIKNNIGLIGGRGHYALYFIGVTDDSHLIYLDPHFKQTSLKNISELSTPENQQSYFKKRFYFLDIKNASPAFTFGIYFTSVNQFKQTQYSLKVYSKTENPIIKYKGTDNTFQEERLEESQVKENVEFKYEEVDDFCVISK